MVVTARLGCAIPVSAQKVPGLNEYLCHVQKTITCVPRRVPFEDRGRYAYDRIIECFVLFNANQSVPIADILPLVSC